MNAFALKLGHAFNVKRFFQGQAPTRHAITLGHRNIYILPTWRGLGFIGLIALLLLIAFIYNNNLAYLLTFLLASVFFVSILHCFKALYGVTIKPLQSHAAFADQNVGFSVAIHSPGGRRPSLAIKLHQQQDIPFALQSSGTKRIQLNEPAIRRGRHDCGAITLSSKYPLGLLRAWAPVQFSLAAVVYPKPNPTLTAFPEHHHDDGEHSGSQKGFDDFAGIKNYQAGDPIKHIHWKAMARGQGLLSKAYEGGQSRQLWLDLQQTPGNDLEARLQTLCRWVVEAEKQGLRYGLLLPNEQFLPDNGNAHYLQCLEALALV